MNFIYGKYPNWIKVVDYEKNRGLGYALKEGILACDYEYVARMDSDDIAVNNRFETQIKYIETHPYIDILGGYLEEYDEEMKQKIGIRKVPLSKEKIYQNLGKQCPFNHSSVILKKKAVLQCGNYEEGKIEDYKLWIEMCKQNCNMENLPEIFIYYRTSKKAYQRRSGFTYLWEMKKVEDRLRKYQLITKFQYIKNMLLRTIIALCPIRIKQLVYPYGRRKMG